MPFLITPILFVNWHRKQNKETLSIILIIFLILLIFFITNFYIYGIGESINSTYINFIYRIDIELIVIIIHWGVLIIFLRMNNFLAIFFGHIFWTVISKPYFSFILIINTLLLFIFYHEETLNEVNNISILMFSLIGGGLTFPSMILFYIFYELPLKRVIRFFYKNDYDIKDEEVEYKIKEISDHSESDDNNSEKIIKNKIE